MWTLWIISAKLNEFWMHAPLDFARIDLRERRRPPLDLEGKWTYIERWSTCQTSRRGQSKPKFVHIFCTKPSKICAKATKRKYCTVCINTVVTPGSDVCTGAVYIAPIQMRASQKSLNSSDYFKPEMERRRTASSVQLSNIRQSEEMVGLQSRRKSSRSKCPLGTWTNALLPAESSGVLPSRRANSLSHASNSSPDPSARFSTIYANIQILNYLYMYVYCIQTKQWFAKSACQPKKFIIQVFYIQLPNIQLPVIAIRIHSCACK